MSLLCYHCGASLAKLSLPFRRLDECPECTKQMHVCRMCVHYDPSETSKQCREDDAEEVRNKESANFCDYFAPDENAFSPEDLRAEEQARRRLDELFGEAAADGPDAGAADETRRSAEDLFRK